MRRCLHACLIGVLTLSLSMDTARACWYSRQACHGRPSVAVACQTYVPACPATACVEVTPWVVVETWNGCGEAEARAAGCGDVGAIAWETTGAVVTTVDSGCDCGGMAATDVVVADGIVVAGEVSSWPAVETVEQSVVGDEPVAASEPTPAESVMPPAATADLPALQPATEPAAEPVRQATALADAAAEPESPAADAAAEPKPMAPENGADAPKEQPASEPVAEEEPAPAEEAPVAEEQNIFEEVEQAGGPGGDSAAVVPMPAAAAGDPPAVDDASAQGNEKAPGDEPAVADPFDAAGPIEPVRRWIDSTGGYAVVGTLVAVGEDGICELVAAGRTLRVALSALSDHDREYAQQAAARLTVSRPAEPAAEDTAGL